MKIFKVEVSERLEHFVNVEAEIVRLYNADKLDELKSLIEEKLQC